MSKHQASGGAGVNNGTEKGLEGQEINLLNKVPEWTLHSKHNMDHTWLYILFHTHPCKSF